MDTFQVGGSSNRVPVICGDNNGQHSKLFSDINQEITQQIVHNCSFYLCLVYIDVPSSATKATDVQLMFNFAAGTGTIPRSWNIKIAMLPCGASYLGN